MNLNIEVSCFQLVGRTRLKGDMMMKIERDENGGFKVNSIKHFVAGLLTLLTLVALLSSFASSYYGNKNELQYAIEDLAELKQDYVPKEIMDARLQPIQDDIEDIKSDMKEIKGDIKLILTR